MPVFMPDHLTFDGAFRLDRPLEPRHRLYLESFLSMRHEAWDTGRIGGVPDPLREEVGLPIGEQGMYFTAELADQGLGGRHPAVIAALPAYYGAAALTPARNPTRTVLLVPGYWCHWKLDAGGSALQWDGQEEFYAFADWLGFLIEHFLEPWGYSLIGRVTYRDNDDGVDGVDGTITVINNVVAWGEDGSDDHRA